MAKALSELTPEEAAQRIAGSILRGKIRGIKRLVDEYNANHRNTNKAEGDALIAFVKTEVATLHEEMKTVF